MTCAEQEPPGPAALHVVYRSYGGENRKGRPDWYSKVLALTSLVRAVEAVDGDVEVLFVNDGPVPEERLSLMHRAGHEVLRIDKGSNRGSLRWALRLAERRGWPPDDLVLLLEDDYLLVPTALQEVVQAARRWTAVDYFAVYGQPSTARPTTYGQQGPDSSASGQSWVPFDSTTSSFAVRVGALLVDHARLSLLPFTGGAWDHATCMVVQGRPPFSLRDTFLPDPAPAGTPAHRRAARVAALAAVRLLGQASAVRRPTRRRLLYGPAVPVATHMETGLISDGRDWPALAAETEAWWRDRQAGPEARAGA
ncbi:MAG: hypothetical protein JWN08_3108 [Frankiales bacterium]|nr:hypothetical protein [Frankiales bacterium]